MATPDQSPEFSPKPMRLQRFLSQCGLGSRRDCEELITEGRVWIDGVTVTKLGATVNPSTQKVSLDGERLKLERKKYFVLNKPAGYLCTADDPEGRRVVLDLFPNEGPRLFTVGRLDENTTGLLIVTNDGDLAQKLSHPRYRIYRYYRAQIAGHPAPEVYEELKKGLYFTEGRFRVYAVKPLRKQKESTWIEVTMTEGQNREVRRLFARVGHKVMKLERIGYGPIRLGRIALGEYRELRREELAQLHTVLDRNLSGDLEPAEEQITTPAHLERASRPPKRSSRGTGTGTGQRRSSTKGLGDRQGPSKRSAAATPRSARGEKRSQKPGERSGTGRAGSERSGTSARGTAGATGRGSAGAGRTASGTGRTAGGAGRTSSGRSAGASAGGGRSGRPASGQGRSSAPKRSAGQAPRRKAGGPPKGRSPRGRGR